MASPQQANDLQEEPLAGPAMASNPSRRQSRLSLPVFQHPSRYSVTLYRKEAMILRQILLGYADGHYLTLQNFITDFDDITCDILYKTMCSDRIRRDKFVRQAEALLDQPGNLTTSEDAFQKFLFRFRQGPSQEDPDILEDEPEQPAPSQSGREF